MRPFLYKSIWKHQNGYLGYPEKRKRYKGSKKASKSSKSGIQDTPKSKKDTKEVRKHLKAAKVVSRIPRKAKKIQRKQESIWKHQNGYLGYPEKRKRYKGSKKVSGSIKMAIWDTLKSKKDTKEYRK